MGSHSALWNIFQVIVRYHSFLRLLVSKKWKAVLVSRIVRTSFSELSYAFVKTLLLVWFLQDTDIKEHYIQAGPTRSFKTVLHRKMRLLNGGEYLEVDVCKHEASPPA